MSDNTFDFATAKKPVDSADTLAATSLAQSSWDLVGLTGKSNSQKPDNLALATVDVTKGDAQKVDIARADAAKIDRDEPGKDWVAFGFLSHHQDRDAHFNERNYGLGWEHKINEDLSTSVGFYKNSIRKESVYGAVMWQPLHLGPLKAGVMAGTINGYPRLNHGNFIPMALPVASIEGRNVGANFVCIPKLKDVSAVCAVQLKVRF